MRNATTNTETTSLRVLSGMAEIAAEAWDGVAVPARSSGPRHDSDASPAEFNPFVTHAFLSALEESGCVGGRSGWTPRHLIMERRGEIVGCAPAYLKAHSQGEYVFDHAWADALHRVGGSYYPKLQVAVPYTPVPGPRLMLRGDGDPRGDMAVLARGLATLAERAGASSVHVTFLPETEWRALADFGFLQRSDQQFHWHNRGYDSFDGFLRDLASRKRKMIQRERRAALAADITIRRHVGREITEALWDAFFAFYMDTGSRKWGRPYLNRRFFSLLGQKLPDHVLLVVAYRAGRPIAGALNLIGSHALFGRNWGALEHHPFLHFEVCYYQAIEAAIERKMQRVEAGAQGEHKLARGYLPSRTFSSHLIFDPRLRRAVGEYLDRERAAVGGMIDALTETGPFRKHPIETGE
jgi:predicted N-acyltransferase